MTSNTPQEIAIIYKTTNMINGKWYIGKHTKGNPDYLGSGVALLRAIKKYGKENFTREILAECNISEVDNLEQEFIRKLQAVSDPMSYNMNHGGSGGNSLVAYTPGEMAEFKLKCSHFGDKNGFYMKKHKAESINKMIAKKTGTKYPSKRLFTPEQQLEIKSMHKDGIGTGKIAKHFSTTGPTILRYVRE